MSGQIINRSTLLTGQKINQTTSETRTAYTPWEFATDLCGMMWTAIAATTTLVQKVSDCCRSREHNNRATFRGTEMSLLFLFLVLLLKERSQDGS